MDSCNKSSQKTLQIVTILCKYYSEEQLVCTLYCTCKVFIFFEATKYWFCRLFSDTNLSQRLDVPRRVANVALRAWTQSHVPMCWLTLPCCSQEQHFQACVYAFLYFRCVWVSHENRFMNSGNLNAASLTIDLIFLVTGFLRRSFPQGLDILQPVAIKGVCA